MKLLFTVEVLSRNAGMPDNYTVDLQYYGMWKEKKEIY
jgi:hypothetical protein